MTPTGSAHPATLDREAVVSAALDLLDDAGVDGLTMRALANRLGTFPNTVYWHVGNRERVLAQVVDRVLSGIRLPDPATMPWADWLKAVARDYRRVLHEHPEAAPVVASQVLVSPPSLPIVEAVLSVLAGAGFSGRALSHAFNAFVGSLVGWVSIELAQTPREPVGWQQDFAQVLRDLDPVDYPTISRHASHLVDQTLTLRWHSGTERPLDASFEAAVAVWMRGLEAAAGSS